MSQYDILDKLIVAAVRNRKSPLYERNCVSESERIALATGRDDMRVIDGRIQYLRKSGVIIHIKKGEWNGAAGWHVVENTKKELA
jgi:hypothetical protein